METLISIIIAPQTKRYIDLTIYTVTFAGVCGWVYLLVGFAR